MHIKKGINVGFVNITAIFMLFETIPLIFLDYEWIVYLTLINVIIMIYMVTKKLFESYKAIYLVILGYSVLIFLDIVKFNYIDYRYVSNDIVMQTIFLSYLSFFLVLISYIITQYSFSVRRPTKEFQYKKFKRRVLPLSLFLLVIFLLLDVLIPNLGKNPVILLIGFLPKATILFLFFLYFKTKRKFYMILAVLFLLFSFAESSRRIYITFFFILAPILMASLSRANIKINMTHKFLFLIIIAIFFVFLNYMRASHNYGAGYKETDQLSNTITYITTLKSLDTFYNTAFIIKNIPSKYDYYWGETYLSVPVMLVPRSIWPSKPIGFAAQLGVLEALDMRDFTFEAWNSINKFSLSPGFVGEAYANFGFFGVIFLSMLFGISAKVFDKSINPMLIFDNYNLMPYLSLYGSFFLMLRGDFFSAVYFSVFFFLYSKIILRIIR